MAKRGRKRNSAVKAIAAIAWYHCVARAAGIEKPAQLGKIFQAEESRIWNKHQKGKPPGPTTLRLVEQKFPGTAKIFEVGLDDCMLWDAMNNEDAHQLYEIVRSTTCYFVRIDTKEDPLPRLLGVYRAQLLLDGLSNSPWASLAELIAIYRGFVIRFRQDDKTGCGRRHSAFNQAIQSRAEDMEDATIAFGLLRNLMSHPSLAHQLTQYGIGEQLTRWAKAIERARLEEDDELRCEILQCAGDDPISAYLDNPIAFVSRTMAVSGKKGRRLAQCRERFSPIDYFEIFLRQLPGHSEDSHPPGMDKKKLH